METATMDLPDFIKNMPSLDVPFPEEIVTTSAIRSDAGVMVLFTFHQDAALPAHAHKGQWGTVVEGEVHLTIDGKTTIYRKGESYNIPSGVEHSVKVPAGTIALDIFEEPDRYPLR
jgi:quercetin dioxygenase-like cupin family protein